MAGRLQLSFPSTFLYYSRVRRTISPLFAAAIETVDGPGLLDQARAFVALRVKRTDSGAALSQRTGLADADQAFYFYNGKMVVDGVDGNALKQFGQASFRVVAVHDHVVDVPEGVDAFLDG